MKSLNRSQAFCQALASYRAAQAAILEAEGREGHGDEEIDAALERLHDATMRLLNTPIGLREQLPDKFAVLEELVTQERSMGESAFNYPVIALASVKRDLLEMEDLFAAQHALIVTAAA